MTSISSYKISVLFKFYWIPNDENLFFKSKNYIFILFYNSPKNEKKKKN